MMMQVAQWVHLAGSPSSLHAVQLLQGCLWQVVPLEQPLLLLGLHHHHHHHLWCHQQQKPQHHNHHS